MRFTYLVVLVLSVAASGSANIRSQLQDFYNALPKFSLSLVVSRHYLFDADFYDGYSYLKSSSFQNLLQQDIAKSPEIQAIADYFGYKIDIAYIQSKFRSLSFPLEPTDDIAMERTFSSFVDEVVEYVPISTYRNLIRQKIASDEEFASFYKKIMDPEFKRLVYRARNSDSLARAVKTLKSHSVDVDYLLRVAFNLLGELKQ